MIQLIMRCRVSILGIVVIPFVATSHAETPSSPRVTTTVYVGRHFEVRDHEQPVKYAFNGDTRVARITGSLSPNARIQRLRLRTGWNLISLAVSAPDLLGQFQEHTVANGMVPSLQAVHRWQPTTGDYTMVGPGETVAGGTLLWIHTRTNFVISVRGDYAQPAAPTIPAGGAYVQGLGLEAWQLQLPPGVTVWKFDAGGRCWQAGFAGDLAPLGDIPSELGPGEAIYLHSSESIELSIPEPELRVAYYHQDHLGSSSVTTDSAGRLAEETAYYPFGAARHHHRPREAHGHYGFTQKERDRESRLNYFEARYLASPLARFLSFDPLVQKLEALEAGELKSILTQPAKLNPFTYALNNPVRYVDPDGRDARPRPSEPRPRQTETKPEKPKAEFTIRIGPPSKQPGEIPALGFSVNRPGGSSPTGTGASRDVDPRLEFHIMRHTDKVSTELFRKSQKDPFIESLTLILPGKDGKDFRIHMTDVQIGAFSVSGDPMEGKLFETFSLNPGTVRFDDPDNPEPPPRRIEWGPPEPRTGG